jgi:hypothetical protein
MNIVRPINIASPITGASCKPKLIRTERDGKIYVEAMWYCPDSGQFIRKGLISVVDKKTGEDVTTI